MYEGDTETPSKIDLPPIVKDSNKDLFYWNERFQAIIEKPNVTPEDLVQRRLELRLYVDAFNLIAKPVVHKILNNEINQIKPGGIAGGEKYRNLHIFSKLSIDQSENQKTWIYGKSSRNDELAMKSANNELRALNAIVACNLKYLHIPFTAVITTRGFRVSCIANLPIASETRIYGSSDAKACEMKYNSEFERLLQVVADKYHLKKHGIKDQSGKDYDPIYGPMDLEGHDGKDGRVYVVDTARLFPPMIYNKEIMPFNSSLYNLIRPELLLNPELHDIKLNSDLYRSFNVNNPQDESNAEIVTKFLLREVIPRFAKNFESNLKGFPNLTKAIHSHGINIRFLGLLLIHVNDNSSAKLLVLSNMVARAFSGILNSDLRNFRGNLDPNFYREKTILSLRKLFTFNDGIWDDVKKKILDKFFLNKEMQYLFEMIDFTNNDFEKFLGNMRNIDLSQLSKDIETILGVEIKGMGNNLEITEIKHIELSPWMQDVPVERQSQIFKSYEETYLSLLSETDEKKKLKSSSLMFTLTHLGDLYTSQSTNGSAAKKAEEYYIRAFKEMEKYKQINFGSESFQQELDQNGTSFELKLLHAATILEKLGDLYAREDLLTAASTSYNKAILLKKKVLGDENPHLGYPLIQSAHILWKKGDFISADDQFKAAAKISDLPTEASLQHARLIINLVPYQLRVPDKLKIALENCKAAKKIFKSFYGTRPSLDLAIACDNKGQCLLIQSLQSPIDKVKMQKAVGEFSKSLKIKKQMIGEQNFSYASTLDHYTTAVAIFDSVSKSVTTNYDANFSSIRKIFEEKLSSQSSFLAKSWNNSAVVPFLAKNQREALIRIEKAQEIVKNMHQHIEKKKLSEQIYAIVESNAKNAKGNSFDLKSFQVARHDSFVGLGEKGFQLEVLPVDVAKFLDDGRTSSITLDMAESILFDISQYISNKLTDPKRSVVKDITQVIKRIENFFGTTTAAPQKSPNQISKPLHPVKPLEEVVFSGLTSAIGAGEKEQAKSLITKEEFEKSKLSKK